MPYMIKDQRVQRPLWAAIWQSGILCRCPRCGIGRLYEGIVKVRSSCEHCGLDLGEEDSGDGPAPFLTMLVGVLILPPALWYEFTFEPPIWHHAFLWLPPIVLLTIGALRPLKALLIAMQYRFKAGEADETFAEHLDDNEQSIETPQDKGPRA